MASVTRSVHIQAPAESVWRVLEDVRLLPRFSPSTVSVDAPPRLERRGQTFEQSVELAGRCFRSTWRVEDVEPGRRLVIAGSVLPGTRYRMTEELTDRRDGTSDLELTMDYRLPLGPLGRLAARLGVERRATDEATQVLEGVRRHVERARGISAARA